MALIVQRLVKGSPLTLAEHDANFININNELDVWVNFLYSFCRINTNNGTINRIIHRIYKWHSEKDSNAKSKNSYGCSNNGYNY